MIKSTDPPKNSREIAEKVCYRGGFLEAYDYLLKNVLSKESSSLIVRGNVGSGKKTLIRSLEDMHKKERLFTSIWLNPYHHTDDYSALRHLALKLNLKPTTSINDLIQDITNYGAKRTRKIVIVLYDFEVFCRQKQSLLYCLTNLTQSGRNFCLFGLTTSVDCLANLEKRIRSRLNAHFYELKPYKNEDEFIEFAQDILGDCKITGEFEEELVAMWRCSNRSIRTLKKYLIAHSTWIKRGKLSLLPPREELSYKNGFRDRNALVHRLSWLTRPQLDLLILSIAYCNSYDSPEFSLNTLGDFARKTQLPNFKAESPLTFKNLALLVKIGLIKQKKAKMISPTSVFSIGVLPAELKAILEQHSEFRSLKMDPFWKRW